MSGVGQAFAVVFAAIKTVGTTVATFAAAHPVVWAAAKVAASVAIGALTAPNVTAARGGPVTIQLNPDAGLPIIVGRTATGGKCVYRNSFHGNKNRVLGLITVLSAWGPVQSIEATKVNDVAVTFSGSPPNAVGGYHDHLWRYTQLGAKPEAAFTIDNATFGQTQVTGFTSAHKLSGLAAVQLLLKSSPEVFPQLPQIYSIVGMGVSCWDPRTVPTWAPPSSRAAHETMQASFTYNANAVLHALQFALGRWERDPSVNMDLVKVGGVGLPIEAVDVPSFIEAANVNDANSWTVGGELNTADDKYETLAALLQAGGCEPVIRGGKLGVMVKAPRVGLWTITADDLAGACSKSGPPARRARYNRVVPKYRSEDHKWQIIPATAISSTTYLAQDSGQVRTMTAELPLVQDLAQAAQLAAYALADGREAPTYLLRCKPRMRTARVGEAGYVDIPALRPYAGAAPQKVVLTEREVDPATGVVTLTLRAETDAKHAWALGQSGAVQPAVSTTPADLTDVPDPGAGVWTATGGTVASAADNAAEPAVIITGAVDYPEIEFVVVEYKKHADSTWMPFGTFNRNTTRIEITGLASGVSYDTRVSYQLHGVTSGTPLALGAATAGTATPADATVSTPKIVDNAVSTLGTQVQTSGWGGAGVIFIAYEGAGHNTYTQLDDYVFTAPATGTVDLTWIGPMDGNRNAATDGWIFMCVNYATPQYLVGQDTDYDYKQPFKINQNALIVPQIVSGTFSGLTPSATYHCRIFGKTTQNPGAASVPSIGLNATTKPGIFKK